MAGLAALIGRVLVAVLGNTALTQAILNALGIPAQQDTLLGVATDAAISRSVLDWSDVSPGPLKTALIAIEADMATMSAAVLAAIADAQQAADPVILPTIPPTGYGGASGSTIADAVWNYDLPSSTSAAGDALSHASNFVVNFDNLGAQTRSAYDGRWIYGTSMKGMAGYHDITYFDVNVDYDTIISSDATVLEWLQRVYWDYGVTWVKYDSMTGFRHLATGVYYLLDLTEQQFRLMRDASPSSLVLPPLWPGLAAVDLGTPVALDTGVTITEPMEGVIVTITDQPSRLVFFSFDDANSYRNLGALSFFSDNGDQEPFQPLGFTSSIYCAKTMARAAGVKLRTSGGVSGTVTPWTIAAG